MKTISPCDAGGTQRGHPAEMSSCAYVGGGKGTPARDRECNTLEVLAMRTQWKRCRDPNKYRERVDNIKTAGR